MEKNITVTMTIDIDIEQASDLVIDNLAEHLKTTIGMDIFKNIPDNDYNEILKAIFKNCLKRVS